jgi:aconitate hydratase
MSPENGATMGFFPVDAETLRYLRVTGRDEAQVALVEAYCKAQGLWRDAETPPAEFTAVIEIDLSAVEPSVSGPSRPQDRLPLAAAPAAFKRFLTASTKRRKESSASSLKDGDVVIAAITSCTNTSNPSVMIGAGLLARNALARGLKARPWVKTSLSPGSRVVADYLAQSGLQRSLDALGFQPVGFGCMTCMGNSGPLPAAVAGAIEADGVTAVAVLSGNRNFEGRIHPSVRASFLASPPLVVAYALAGSMLVDLAAEPLGADGEGRPVYLQDIWPDGAEIGRIVDEAVTPGLYRARYATMQEGSPGWRALRGAAGTTFPWDPASTFIRRPPFFDDMSTAPPEIDDIRGARVLAMFGDMFTTDHISPIGVISPGTPAADYLASLGIAPRDFVNYAARRLNHDVMIRGTFANVRARNEMTPDVEGSSTVHYPDGERMPIHAAAARYRDEGVPLVVIAGSEYGAGSSRDWAAKGTRLLGVRAVIAESFERIHRSNLVGMGVLPLQFPDGVTRRTLGLTGAEIVDVTGIRGHATLRSKLACRITRADGRRETIRLLSRLDTTREIDYFRNGGLLHHVVRHRLTPEVRS